jgi:hypothetical protein
MASHRAAPGGRDLKFIVGETCADTEAYESGPLRVPCAEQSPHQLGDVHRSG